MSLTQDWRFKNECFPFEDDNNYYITVESAYETPGDQKEARLLEANRDGVFKLLKFYGKDTTGVFEEQGGIFDTSSVEDYYVAYRPCIRMKVLVSIPKENFDAVQDDPTACELNIPEEGYLSAFIPVGEASTLISRVVEGMTALIPTLINAENYISNVNIIRETRRLAAAGRAIQRYLELNNVAPVDIIDPECVQPTEVDRQLEIGFSYDYKAVFALVEGDQHTIGYDCFLENNSFNHDTTANYLLNIKNMLSDLNLRNEPSFNAFDFFTKYTIPTPIILPKESNLDGLEKYDENGNLFSFANIAKLITLDLDVNLCKTDAEKAQEDSLMFDSEIKTNIAKAAKQTKDFIGDNKLSTEGVQKLRERLQDASDRSENEGALKILYEDVMAKVNFGCVLEETIQCLLENLIATFGQEVFDDPDLAQVINVQNVSLGGLINNCRFDRCDGSPDVGLKVGFPVFQGINIPNNLPTLDFLAETIDNALVSLYNTLVSSLSSLILGILEGLCDLLFSLPDGIAQIGEGFKSWLSQTLGIDLSLLDDPEAWKSALLTSTGGGFIGVIGKAASTVQNAVIDTYTQTGIALNLPNPETGQIEKKFISPEFITTFFSELNDGVDDMETVLTPSETQSIFRGNARPEVLDLAYKCVTRNGSTIFTSPESFQDTMSGIGDVLQPQFLLSDISEQPQIASDYCDLLDDLTVRKEILKGKDSTLTSEEIDEIINKEKERKKKTLLEKVDELNSYQAGGFAPSFPSIFGDGGLIPEPPPVINDISNIVADGLLAAAIINFTADASYYNQLWGQLFGVDAEGETLEVLGAAPRELYGLFDGGVKYNQKTTETDIAYNFGYLESLTENAVGNIDTDSSPSLDILGGAETVIFQDFGKNFKRDDFRPELASTFFNGFPTDTAESILDFLEDKDEENGFHQQLFFDADNPLISYAVLVYHEGGRVGKDRLTEATLIKNEFDPVDQPETKEVVYDYGKLFGTSDKSAFKDQLLNTSWEGALSAGDDFADELAESIVDIANNDWGKLLGKESGYVAGAAAAAGGSTALLLSGPLLAGAAKTAIVALPGILGGSTGVGIFSAISAAAGPIGWAIFAAAVLIGLAFVVTRDSRDIAQRIIIEQPQDGFLYAYDIIVSDKNNQVKVVERKISESLISTAGEKSPGWPSDIVTLTKGTGTGISSPSEITKVQKTIGVGSVTQYNQDFFFDNTGAGFGLKIGDGGLKPLSYEYLNNENVNYGISTLALSRVYPLAASTLANMVEDSLSEFFTDSSDAQVIQDISDEIKSNFKILNLTALLDIIETVRDEPNRQYWSPGYNAGLFDGLNLNENTLNYSSLKSEFMSFNSKLLDATFQNKYCDTIDALRRSNASQALVLMIRLYIVEQAAISLQVFNKFDLAFMDSNIFSSNILSLMSNDMTKYQTNFEGVDANLYQQLLNAAEKYTEALAIVNDEEPVVFSKKYQYLEDLIKKEIPGIKSSIASSLNLGQNWRTWDGFVTERVFPVFDTPTSSDTSLKTEPPISSFGDEPKFEFTATGPTPFELDTSYDWFADMKTYYGSAVPTEILDKIGLALEEWLAPVYKGGEGIPGVDLSRTEENELEVFVTETIGEIQYSYEYKFEVDGRVLDEGESNEEATTKYTGKIVVRGAFTDDYLQRITDDAILSPFNNPAGGFAFETYVKYAPQGKTYTIDGLTNFLSLLRKEVEDGTVNGSDKLLETYDYIRFGYRMTLVQDVTNSDEAREPSTYGKLSSVQARSNKQKAFILTNQARSINGSTQTYDYISIPIVSAECEYVDTTPNQDITIQQFLDTIEAKYSSEIYANIKSILTETDEYQRVVNLILPLKDLISATSFYQYSALSDETVFLNSVNGVTLHNMTSRAKLSTLQTFYTSIYGGRQISFQDPFTKNLLT